MASRRERQAPALQSPAARQLRTRRASPTSLRTEFERTADLELVRELLTHPQCWSRMVNDHAPARAVFHIEARADLEFVLASEDGEPAAVFLLRAGGGFAETHFSFLPAAWGRSEAIARAFVAWVWANTHYRRLVGPVPAYNRLALRLAKRVGFTQFGIE